MSGARFAYLLGPLVRLQFALVQPRPRHPRGARASRRSSRRCWCARRPCTAPASSRPTAPRSTETAEDDLYLVGTSEVPLAGLHGDQILAADDLPLRYGGISTCFRREAGAAGRDTRGIFRVHQFDKVEMFSFVLPEDSPAEHQRILGVQEEILQAIEVPYRVIDIAVGDLGASAARKFDTRGVDAGAGRLPRGHLLLQLHRLPGPPPAHAGCAREGGTAAGAHAERHRRGRGAHDHRDPREPPARGRLGRACRRRSWPTARPRRSGRDERPRRVPASRSWATSSGSPTALGRMPAPGEITYLADPIDEPAGGGGVSAAQVAKLGAECLFFTALGDDEAGRRAAERARADRRARCWPRCRDAPQTRALSAAGATCRPGHRRDRRGRRSARIEDAAALGRPGRLRRRLLHRPRLGHPRGGPARAARWS